MTKREQELLKKIESLEARIKVLEAKQPGETHHHYHYQQPQQYPQPVTWPQYPTITWCSPISVMASGH
jgi:hypothetical protein